MAEKIDAVLAEIEAVDVVMRPEREGLRDLSVLNLQPETLHEVSMAITDYDRRLSLMADAKRSLEALRADGHPTIPPVELPESAYVNVKENKMTIDAIFARMTPAATNVQVSGGSVAPKP